MIILGLTTSYEIYFCANFITSNGFVCKNEGERLLVVCLNVKYFWFQSTGIDYNAFQYLRRTNCIKSIDLLKKLGIFVSEKLLYIINLKEFTLIQLN